MQKSGCSTYKKKKCLFKNQNGFSKFERRIQTHMGKIQHVQKQNRNAFHEKLESWKSNDYFDWRICQRTFRVNIFKSHKVTDDTNSYLPKLPNSLFDETAGGKLFRSDHSQPHFMRYWLRCFSLHQKKKLQKQNREKREFVRKERVVSSCRFLEKAIRREVV